MLEDSNTWFYVYCRDTVENTVDYIITCLYRRPQKTILSGLTTKKCYSPKLCYFIWWSRTSLFWDSIVYNGMYAFLLLWSLTVNHFAES